MTDSFHRTLDAALDRQAGDVEALAEVLHRKVCCDNPGHADWTNCPIDGPCSEDARAVLASDFYAARLAEARAVERERLAQAIEAEVALFGRSDPGDPVRAGLIDGYRDAARIARSEAGA